MPSSHYYPTGKASQNNWMLESAPTECVKDQQSSPVPTMGKLKDGFG